MASSHLPVGIGCVVAVVVRGMRRVRIVAVVSTQAAPSVCWRLCGLRCGLRRCRSRLCSWRGARVRKKQHKESEHASSTKHMLVARAPGRARHGVSAPIESESSLCCSRAVVALSLMLMGVCRHQTVNEDSKFSGWCHRSQQQPPPLAEPPSACCRCCGPLGSQGTPSIVSSPADAWAGGSGRGCVAWLAAAAASSSPAASSLARFHRSTTAAAPPPGAPLKPPPSSL